MLYFIAIILKIRISLYNISIVSTISFTSITTIVITITKTIITDIMTVALGTPPPYLVYTYKKSVFRIDTNMWNIYLYIYIHTYFSLWMSVDTECA